MKLIEIYPRIITIYVHKHYLIQVDDDPEDVTESEHHDNADEDEGNAFIPVISPDASPGLDVPAPPDGLVEQSVEDWQDEERAQGHHQEVSQEDVVTDVVGVLSQLGGADSESRLLVGGVGLDGGQVGAGGQQIIWSLQTGVELKPALEENIVKYQHQHQHV